MMLASRDTVVAAILDFLGRGGLLPLDEVRVALEREIDAAGPEALVSLKAHLAADDGWTYHPPDPLARRLHHLLADRFLERGSTVDGLHHLDALESGPLTIFANHLSYADANVVDVLLQRAGAGALAARLTAMAGPKVFTSRQRRFSSLCFGTIKVPQSSGVSSEDAVMDPREVARAARRSIDIAHERLRLGDVLLVFGEGTRSRTASLQSMLPGVARYLTGIGTWILPAGLTGPESLFPVDAATVHPARVCMRIGSPMRGDHLLAHAAGNRRVAMDAIGLAIAELLPPAYRGLYANAAQFPAAAEALRRTKEC
jgi:1-acyl-sn-glycerol-3-phosphate acyltransferase